MAKDLSADTEGGSLMNESDTHFLIVNVFHGATEWSLIICSKLQVLLKPCQKKKEEEILSFILVPYH